MVMGANFCPNCGQRVKLVANFCPRCGVKLANLLAAADEPLEGIEPEYIPQGGEKQEEESAVDGPAGGLAEAPPVVEVPAAPERGGVQPPFAEDEELPHADAEEPPAPHAEASDSGETMINGFPVLKRRKPADVANAARLSQDPMTIPSDGLAQALAAMGGGAAVAAAAKKTAAVENREPEALSTRELERTAREEMHPTAADEHEPQPAAALTGVVPAFVEAPQLVPGPVGAWDEAAELAAARQQVAEAEADGEAALGEPVAAEALAETVAAGEAVAEPAVAAVDEAVEVAETGLGTGGLVAGAAVVGAAAAAIQAARVDDAEAAAVVPLDTTPSNTPGEEKERIKLEPVQTDAPVADTENSAPIGADGEVGPAPATMETTEAAKETATPKAEASAPAEPKTNKNLVVALVLLAMIAAVAIYLQMNAGN